MIKIAIIFFISIRYRPLNTRKTASNIHMLLNLHMLKNETTSTFIEIAFKELTCINDDAMPNDVKKLSSKW